MNVNKIITQKIIDRLQEAERTGEKFYWVKPFAKGCPKSFAVAYDTRDEYRGINRILLEPSKEYLTFHKIVLEVGMGGTFDATNVIETPEGAVITNLNLTISSSIISEK